MPRETTRWVCAPCVYRPSIPMLYEWIDVERIPWPRPRRAVVDLVGEQNQSLPLLILSRDAPDELATGSHGPVRFVSGKDEILSVLSRRHGIPDPHP